jgi:hypothetical protein
MYNWGVTQLAVSNMLSKIGFQATLVKADDTKAKAYAVWDSNTKNDLALGASKVTANKKQLYIAGSIKKIPQVGDTIQQGIDLWSITEVEAYKPTSVILVYRVVVQ